MLPALLAVAALAPLLAPQPSAGSPRAGAAAIYGTEPIPISANRSGQTGNAASGGAAISGDNRKARYVAFHSRATNLTRRDTNRTTDVFVWKRPRGQAGLTLGRATGGVTRVSVSSRGRQANGPSRNPALDGSLSRRPHCVVFESRATNLASGDRDRRSDIFLRDLRTRRTRLISRGIRTHAYRPTIDGACRQVAFDAGGRIYLARIGKRPRSLGRGRRPDFSLDGSALVWERGRAVVIRTGRRVRTVVSRGSNPRVTDRENDVWGVVFDTSARLTSRDRNSSQDVYTRVMRTRGGPRRTDLISAPRRGAASLNGHSANGGVTAYATNRGIITFVHTRGGLSSFFYRNNNSGNIDDLAHFGVPGIWDATTSARSNFVAFTAAESRAAPAQIYFKHLVDGEAL